MRLLRLANVSTSQGKEGESSKKVPRVKRIFSYSITSKDNMTIGQG